MLKFGVPTIALPLAIKKCTVQTGSTVYAVDLIKLYVDFIQPLNIVTRML